jgi:hypothetical protein
VLIGATIVRMIGGFRLLRSAILLVVEAISFLSTALLATPAGRVVLAIAAALELVIAVWEREKAKQQGWINSTNAHANALNELKAAIDAVKAGVPGAEENLKRLAQAHLDSARAALEDAKAQVAQQQQIVDAMKAGGDFAAPLGADIDTQTEALLRANINLAKRTRELDDVQKTLDGKVVGNIEDPSHQNRRRGGRRPKYRDQRQGSWVGCRYYIRQGRKPRPPDHGVSRRRSLAGSYRRKSSTSSMAWRTAPTRQPVARCRRHQCRDGGRRVKNVSSEVTNSIAAVPDAIKPDKRRLRPSTASSPMSARSLRPRNRRRMAPTQRYRRSMPVRHRRQPTRSSRRSSLPGKIGSIMSGLNWPDPGRLRQPVVDRHQPCRALRLDPIGVPPYSRAQHHADAGPDRRAAQLARTVNGTLIDLPTAPSANTSRRSPAPTSSSRRCPASGRAWC